MLLNRALVSLVVSAAVSQGICDEPAAAPDETSAAAREILEKCEKYRIEHFQEGDVVLHIIHFVEDEGGNTADELTITKRIWFSGECRRNDSLAGPSRYRTAMCGDKYIWSSNEDLSVVVAPSNEYTDTRREFGLSHMRWIGMGYNAPLILEQGRGSRCLWLSESTTAQVASVQKENLDGLEVWKVCYVQDGTFDSAESTQVDAKNDDSDRKTDNDPFADEPEEKQSTELGEMLTFHTENTYWIAPSQGYALVKNLFTTHYPDKQLELVHELDAKYAEDVLSGTWYPKTVTTKMRDNGKLNMGRRYLLENVTFQKPDPAVFELKGFSLANGRRISDRTLGPIQHEFFWDGAKPVLIPSPGDAVKFDPAAAGNGRGRNILLIANGFGLFLLAAFFLLKRRVP